MNDICKVFLSLSVSGTIIAFILLALKPILKDRVSKTWQYYIWLAVIIRLLLPFSSEINVVGRLFSKIEGMPFTQQSQEQSRGESTFSSVETNNYITPPAQPLSQRRDINPQTSEANYLDDLIKNIWLMWIVPAIMLFVRKVTSYNSFVRYIKAGITETTDCNALAVFDVACRDAGLKKPLNIYTNKLAVSPMLVGIFRPFIVLPGTELGENELYNIFIHELTHYKRLDIFYKWMTQLAVCLHWYNPVVYLISREINKSCELSCDEAIIKSLDMTGKRDYGDTLLASLKLNGNYGDVIASVTLNEDAKLLKERLGAIMKFKNNSKSMTVLSSFLTIAVICGTLATGAYAAPAGDSTSSGENPVQYVSSTNSPVTNTSNGLTGILAAMPNTYNAADKAAIKLMEYSGSWDVTELLIPFMSESGIDRVVEIYNRYCQKTGSATKNPTDYYNIESDTDDADNRALTMMDQNGMWEYTTPIFPYMSNEGIDAVVELYNLKHMSSTQKKASNYYNLDKNAGVNANQNDSGKHTPATTTPTVLDGIYIDADKVAINLIEYSGSWEVTELLIPFMSKAGIDKVVEIYNIKTNSGRGTKKPEDYYNIESDTDDADARALTMMQSNGMWEYTEPMLPYMSNKGIDKVVDLYNQKHSFSVPKKAADYYNLGEAPTGNELFSLSSKNGYNIASSGSFHAKDGQVLTLTITSSIKGGTVDFFLFDPADSEQRITIGSSNMTQEIELAKGQWQYNCSGIFKDGGELEIIGTVK